MLNINELNAFNPDIETKNEAVFEKARAYNAVINGNDAKAIESAEKEAQDAAAAFNALAIETAYTHWLTQEKPMLAALRAGTIAQASIKVSASKNGGKSVECANTNVLVNLADFDKFAAEKGVSVTVKSSWKAAMEEARKVFCGSCVKETQDTADVKNFMKTFEDTFAFAYGGAHADCGEEKQAQRYSMNNCVRALQYALDCILYDDASGEGKNKYRVLRSDANVVRLTITKRGRSLHNLTFPNAATFLKNVTDTMIRIVTDKKYTCDYTTK